MASSSKSIQQEVKEVREKSFKDLQDGVMSRMLNGAEKKFQASEEKSGDYQECTLGKEKGEELVDQ